MYVLLSQVVDGLNTLTMIAKFKVKYKVCSLLYIFTRRYIYTYIQEAAAVVQEVTQFPAPPTVRLRAFSTEQCPTQSKEQFPLRQLLSRISSDVSGIHSRCMSSRLGQYQGSLTRHSYVV